MGRRELTEHGVFMAAVLSCGRHAILTHESAAALWGIRPSPQLHVSVVPHVARRSRGVTVHRRALTAARDVTTHHGIPVTTPACTLIDLANRPLSDAQLERAINQADERGLIDPEALRQAVDEVGRRPGARRLRKLLDRRTFRMTRSELERRFLPIVRRAGLPLPLTKQHVNGFEVDFYWPQLDLVVETDGLRYHRTPQQQARDSLRDQAHAAAGVERLRFTHDQIAHDPRYVERILAAVARRISHSRTDSVAPS